MQILVKVMQKKFPYVFFLSTMNEKIIVLINEWCASINNSIWDKQEW